MTGAHEPDMAALAVDIKRWAVELGFDRAGIADLDLRQDIERLDRWLAAGMHGQLDYLQSRRDLRAHPEALQPGAVRAISVRMNYTSDGLGEPWARLEDGEHAYLARFSMGRDYHKVMRKRLQKLAERITAAIGGFGHRVFCDSAPVLEKPLARKAGLGWVGKHTLILSRDAGSWFLLGEILTDLPLPVDAPVEDHCGTCRRCIDVCPTQAIIAPYVLDARRCIAYLTIEQKGAIPEELRRPMGNRVFGCDDCQLICPWNKYAKLGREPDFAPRHGLDAARLIEIFAWTEAQFLRYTEGMAVRRAGYTGWLRNVAVGLGNAPPSPHVRAALHARAGHPSSLVREHVAWALAEQERKSSAMQREDQCAETPRHWREAALRRTRPPPSPD
jgi:epoxyqueuosine reductase